MSHLRLPRREKSDWCVACDLGCDARADYTTANLHVTTLGHGYTSRVHVPHDRTSLFNLAVVAQLTGLRPSEMNLSHVINELSFGPFFPEIAQPLDNSVELTQDRTSRARTCRFSHLTYYCAAFVAYQYFLRVVPTTFVAPRSTPLDTNQYSVTHYTRVLTHDSGTPGIFFKFDIDPIRLTVIQRTATIIQFIIRCARPARSP
jgi:hypothetical protein